LCNAVETLSLTRLFATVGMYGSGVFYSAAAAGDQGGATSCSGMQYETNDWTAGGTICKLLPCVCDTLVCPATGQDYAVTQALDDRFPECNIPVDTFLFGTRACVHNPCALPCKPSGGAGPAAAVCSRVSAAATGSGRAAALGS
jgi:hypothetical protein